MMAAVIETKNIISELQVEYGYTKGDLKNKIADVKTKIIAGAYSKAEGRAIINRIKKEYKTALSIPLYVDFVEQNGMLADRKANKLAGDQEIAYHTRLDKDDVHYHLRRFDNYITKEFGGGIDYKVLVNMYNETANISITKDHPYSMRVLNYLLENIGKTFKIEDVHVVEFHGGSIFNDTGVTGRKLIVEQAAGAGYSHGGGAVYGKDETKTAPAAHKEGAKFARKNKVKNTVVVYFPGDKLNKPNFVGEE